MTPRPTWLFTLRTRDDRPLDPSGGLLWAELAVEADEIRRLWDAIDEADARGIANSPREGTPDPTHRLTFHRRAGPAGVDHPFGKAHARSTATGRAYLIGPRPSWNEPPEEVHIPRDPVRAKTVRRHVTREGVDWTARLPGHRGWLRTVRATPDELAHAALYTDDEALLRRALLHAFHADPKHALDVLTRGVYPDVGRGPDRQLAADLLAAEDVLGALTDERPAIRRRTLALLADFEGERQEPGGRSR